MFPKSLWHALGISGPYRSGRSPLGLHAQHTKVGSECSRTQLHGHPTWALTITASKLYDVSHPTWAHVMPSAWLHSHPTQALTIPLTKFLSLPTQAHMKPTFRPHIACSGPHNTIGPISQPLHSGPTSCWPCLGPTILYLLARLHSHPSRAMMIPSAGLHSHLSWALTIPSAEPSDHPTQAHTIPTASFMLTQLGPNCICQAENHIWCGVVHLCILGPSWSHWLDLLITPLGPTQYPRPASCSPNSGPTIFVGPKIIYDVGQCGCAYSGPHNPISQTFWSPLGPTQCPWPAPCSPCRTYSVLFHFLLYWIVVYPIRLPPLHKQTTRI